MHRRLRVAGRWAGLALLWLVAVWLVAGAPRNFGLDSHAYWLTAHRGSLYGVAPGVNDAYEYAPIFAQVLWPVAHFLPSLAFSILWSAGCAGIFAWLLAPLGWRLGLPLFLCCSPEILVGNIYALLALVLVAGFARPSAWAFPLLTKVAPALGPVWFAVRGEWRKAAVTVGAALALAGVSFLFDPAVWVAWVRYLTAHSSHGTMGLPVRMGAAVLLTVYAARNGRPRILPVAMLFALPIIQGATVFALFAAIPRLPEHVGAYEKPRRPAGEVRHDGAPVSGAKL